MGNVSAFLNLVGTLSNILAMISWLIGKKRSLAIRFVHFLSDDLLEKTEVSSVVTTWTTNKAKSVFIALPMEKLNLTTFCRISRFFPWVSRFSFIRSWQVCTLQATVLSFLLRLLRNRSSPTDQLQKYIFLTCQEAWTREISCRLMRGGTRETHAITTKSSTYPILNTWKIMFVTGVVPLVTYTTVTVSLRSDDRFV